MMKDNEKTKEQLIEELEDLRRRVAELEKSETKRKQTEEALKEGEGLLLQFMKNFPGSAYIKDSDRRIIYLTEKVEEYFGIKPEQWLGKTSEEIWPPEIAVKVRQDDDAVLKGKSVKSITERPQKGTLHTWITQRFPIQRKNKPPLIGCISIDISDRIKAEEALRESEERYRAVFEQSDDGIALVKGGRHIHVNQKMVKIFGYERPEDIIGQPIYMMVHPDDRERVIDFNHRRQKGEAVPPKYEFKGQRKDGESLFIEVSATKTHYQGEVVFLDFLRDVTERKRIEEERIIMSKLESTGILAGGIAHDFNNLLTVILGNLDLVKMFDLSGEEMTNSLEAAKKAAMEARGLTRQLITFAKGGALDKRPISLSGLIEEEVRFTLRGSPVTFKFFIPADLWSVEVDESQIGQCMRNIVLNAREAMPEGGMVSVIAENVVLNTSPGLLLSAGEYVKVSIADQGGGILEEVLSKIFDPYFSTKQQGDQKGMGLGLTICHSIIKKHGGSISVASRSGKGTTVTIYLPATQKAIQKDPAGQEILPGLGRILVMDDEKTVRYSVGMLLRHLGYEVELAEDGKKAVELYQRAKRFGHPFNGVILDLTVQGGMGGKETIRELLKIDPKVKAIVFSGYSNDPVIQDYEKYGFKGAITKPYLIGDLSNILSRVVGTNKTVNRTL